MPPRGGPSRQQLTLTVVTIEFTVSDGNTADDVTHTVSFNVDAVNDDPTAPDRGPNGEPLLLGTIAEDSSLSFTAAELLAGFNDVDNPTSDITITDINHDGPGELTGNATDGWTFTPEADFNGTINISYSVTDGSGGYGGNLQRIEVTSVNDAPELLASAAPTISSIQEDSSITITANQLLAGYGDADDDTLSVAMEKLTLQSQPGSSPVMRPPVGPSRRQLTSTAPLTSLTPSPMAMVVSSRSQTPSKSSRLTTFPLDENNAVPAIADGTEDTVVTIAAADLLSGFSDPEQGQLTIKVSPPMAVPSLDGNGSYIYSP